MSNTFGLTIFAIVAMIFSMIYVAVRTHNRRKAFIESYQWPSGLLHELKTHHPALTANDEARVAQGLRQFFLAYLNTGFRPVVMPSQVADDLWHEFILYTRAYKEFCDKAFGRFLHHTPAAVLTSGDKEGNTGLRRVWWQSCKLEGIDPEAATRLPLLFALDAELNIPNGYRYVPDCSRPRRNGEISVTYCSSDFSSTSFDGTTDGMSDGGGDGGDGGGGD